jgi:DNA-binding beta-propeller fold protein YncE
LRTIVLLCLIMLLTPACAEEYRGRPPLTDGIRYPLSMAVDQDSGLLYVVNSNFDLRYRAASLVGVDMDTNKVVGPSLAFGSFPGDLILANLKDGKSRAGYLAIRGDNSLTWFSVSGKGGSLSLVCSDDGDPAECGGDHVVVEGELPDDGEDEEQTVKVGSDPFGMAFLPGANDTPDRLIVSAINDGTVSLFDLGSDGTPTIVSQLDLALGLHSLTVDPATGIIYISDKNYAILYRVQVEDSAAGTDLVKLSNVVLPAPYATAQFGRGLALAHGGQQIIVSYRTPSSVLVVQAADAVPADDQATLAVIPIASKPGQLRVVPSGIDGRELAYVLAYGDDAMWVIDLEALAPVGRVEVGAGPYDLQAVFTDSAKRAYVSNFLAHTVSVIDLDPASPYYHTQIAEIH